MLRLVWADEEWLKKYAMNEEEDEAKDDTASEEKKSVKKNPKVRFHVMAPIFKNVANLN